MELSRAEVSALVVLLDETINEMECACMREWVGLIASVKIGCDVKFSRADKMRKGDPKLFDRLTALQDTVDMLIKKLEEDAEEK